MRMKLVAEKKFRDFDLKFYDNNIMVIKRLGENNISVFRLVNGDLGLHGCGECHFVNDTMCNAPELCDEIHNIKYHICMSGYFHFENVDNIKISLFTISKMRKIYDS